MKGNSLNSSESKTTSPEKVDCFVSTFLKPREQSVEEEAWENVKAVFGVNYETTEI